MNENELERQIEVDKLINALKEQGGTGLDLSPGDPVCRMAANVIIEMERKIKHLEWVISRHDDGIPTKEINDIPIFYVDHKKMYEQTVDSVYDLIHERAISDSLISEIMLAFRDPENMMKHLKTGCGVILGDKIPEFEEVLERNKDFILVITNKTKIWGVYSGNEISW